MPSGILPRDLCGIARMPSQSSPSNYILSVIIPAYNERFTIRELVKRVMNVPVPKEVIVVDDASTDGTSDVLHELEKNYSLRIIHHEHNQGKGVAIQTGIKEAKGDFIVIQDADLEEEGSSSLTYDWKQVLHASSRNLGRSWGNHPSRLDSLIVVAKKQI